MQPNLEQALPLLVVGIVAGLLLLAIVYVYFAVTMMVVARKTGTRGAWMAWVPLLNLVLLCRIAGMSPAWVLGLLVPILQLVPLVMAYMGVARARGKPAWTGFLILVPGVNLFLPLYLALGPSTAPAGTPRPPPLPPPVPALPGAGCCARCGARLDPGAAFCGGCGSRVAPPAVPVAPPAPPPAPRAACPHCGAATEPGAAFCGDCGGRLAVARPVVPAPPPPIPGTAPAPAPAKPSGGSCLLVGCLTIMLLLVLAGGGAWYLLIGRSLGHRPPERQRPAIPARLAGALRELPVDPQATAPAQPESVVSQESAASPSGGTSGQPVRVPAAWLPAGVGSDTFGRAAAAASAAYRTERGGPATYVHVLDVPGSAQQECAALSKAVAQGIGGQATGIEVETAKGAVYRGSEVAAGKQTVFVLANQNGNTVSIVFAPDLRTEEVARRLAGALGNGEGLDDHPALGQSLALLPEALPAGMELVEASTFRPEDIGPSLGAQGLPQDETEAAALQQVLAQVRMMMPEQVTVGRYRDAAAGDWQVMAGTFGSTSAARMLWLVLCLALSPSMERTSIDGTAALVGHLQGERTVILQAGSCMALIKAPDGVSDDLLRQFAAAMQL